MFYHGFLLQSPYIPDFSVVWKNQCFGNNGNVHNTKQNLCFLTEVTAWLKGLLNDPISQCISIAPLGLLDSEKREE